MKINPLPFAGQVATLIGALLLAMRWFVAGAIALGAATGCYVAFTVMYGHAKRRAAEDDPFANPSG